MQFASDNWAGATPEITTALAALDTGIMPAYGNDPITARAVAAFSVLFEREVEVLFTATGTATNALALSGLSRPGGLIFASAEAHIHMDEVGATEFQSGGMKIITLPEAGGKISPDTLAATLTRYPDSGRFGQPVALSLTNLTELGTTYSPAETAALAAVAKARGLGVHLDGARFANAVAATGASPADLTWKAGVDFMSFGGTKNGCWAAEAIIAFTPGLLKDMPMRRLRAGHVFSKSRFVAQQFLAYLEHGNWLRTARHANAMADLLRTGLGPARLAWSSTGNEVFALLRTPDAARLRAAGANFYDWPAPKLALGPDQTSVRLVTSWATTPADVAAFIDGLNQAL
jgi:threonine aldolase